MNIKVVNQKGETLFTVQSLDPSMTVDQFKRKFAMECDYISKYIKGSFQEFTD